jgi:hypothetical protein
MPAGRHVPAVGKLSETAKRAWDRLQRLGSVAAAQLQGSLLGPAPTEPAEPAVTVAGARTRAHDPVAALSRSGPLTLDQLATWRPDQAAPPCLALFGEFSAGKSSLANLLAGTDILPTSVLSNTRRLTRVRHAERLEITTVDEQGVRRAVDLNEIVTLSRNEISEVEIGLPSGRLRHMEILDTPGFADPYHGPQRALDAAERADLAIWCTRASQAWRHSERQVWTGLPERLRTTGLLVVTHIDTLHRPDDARRLAERLRRETSGLFRALVMLAIPDAAGAHDPATGLLDAARWQQSGGEALAAELLRSLAVLAAERGDAAVGLPAVEPTPAPEPEAKPELEEEEEAAAAPAPPVALKPAAARPARKAAPPPTVPASGPADMLGQLTQAIPDCRLAATIDLASGQPIAVSPATTPAAFGGQLATFAAGLLAGEALAPVRRLGAVAGDAQAPLQEIVIASSGAHYLLLRRKDEPARALVLVGGREMHLGAALARARLALGGR